MDEFDIYLESAGSMNIYSGNTMAAFRNLLAHPIHLEGDWRVALAEIIFPTNIKNITTRTFSFTHPKHHMTTLLSRVVKAVQLSNEKVGQIMLNLKLESIRQSAAFWSN